MDADTVRTMRAKGHIRVLVALLAVSLLPALTVSAHHGPIVEDVKTLAEASLTMSCQPTATQMVCSDGELSQWAVITPASGPLTSLQTRVPALFTEFWVLASNNKAWMADLQNIGCNDPTAVASFMDKVAAMDASGLKGLAPQVVGECTMSATLGFDDSLCLRYPCYVVDSTLAEQSTPTPTPTPTPPPTPTPSPTASPTATPSPTASPTATATASATATATASATTKATPEQAVAGIVFRPAPSVQPQAPDQGGDGWAGSVPSAGEVSTDPRDIAGSAAAALVLLAMMGFVGELFNNTVEGNYARIMGFWGKTWLGRLGRAFSGLWGSGSK